MHLNDLCTGTGNQFNLIQQQLYSSSSQTDVNAPHYTVLNNPTSNLHSTINSLPIAQPQITQTAHSDETNQLNSSLSSSSGVGCTSTSSSGLGTSSLFSSSSLCSTTTNHHPAATMNGSNNGSFVNVLLPLADMNSHNLHRAQLISNLNGSTNQYTTLAFGNYTTSSTSSPSSVNTNATSSTLPSTVPINGQQQHQSSLQQATLSNKGVYAANGQLLNDNNVYCQTSFNSNGAIMENGLPTHYQLLSNKQHLTHNSNYLLQTLPSNQTSNYTAAVAAANLHPPSINSYLNHDELNKYGSNAQFDLICDNRLSPVYSKLSPNSNSLIKECLITNAENSLVRNSSKFIELTSSQNSSSTVYSETLKSRLASSSSKDNLKLMQAANTGLDLLNCDKTYNELIKNSSDLKSRTDSLSRLDKCKGKCAKDKCSCTNSLKSDCPKNGSKHSSKKESTCQRQLSAKVTKANGGCCLSSDNPKKQGICFIILATCILVVLLCFFYSLTTTRNLLGKFLFHLFHLFSGHFIYT